jgi:hypothetical protein
VLATAPDFFTGSSGPAAALARVRRALEAWSEAEKEARKAGRLGGQPLSFTWEALPFSGPLHSPALAEAAERMPDGARLNEAADLRAAVVRSVFTRPVRWTETVARLAREADFVVDLGPGDGVAKLTASSLRGTGARVFPLATPTTVDAGICAAAANAGRPSCTETEVVTDAWGHPGLRLHGRVAAAVARKGAFRLHISLSHDGGYATAFVILERGS